MESFKDFSHTTPWKFYTNRGSYLRQAAQFGLTWLVATTPVTAQTV